MNKIISCKNYFQKIDNQLLSIIYNSNQITTASLIAEISGKIDIIDLTVSRPL